MDADDQSGRDLIQVYEFKTHNIAFDVAYEITDKLSELMNPNLEIDGPSNGGDIFDTDPGCLAVRVILKNQNPQTYRIEILYPPSIGKELIEQAIKQGIEQVAREKRIDPLDPELNEIVIIHATESEAILAAIHRAL